MKMKLEVEQIKREKVTVEVDLPYYYKHDLMLDDADVVIYGKVEKDRETSITISHWFGRPGRPGEREYQLAINPGKPANYSEYILEKEYRSSEKEFLAARAKMLKAVNG